MKIVENVNCGERESWKMEILANERLVRDLLEIC